MKLNNGIIHRHDFNLWIVSNFALRMEVNDRLIALQNTARRMVLRSQSRKDMKANELKKGDKMTNLVCLAAKI